MRVLYAAYNLFCSFIFHASNISNEIDRVFFLFFKKLLSRVELLCPFDSGTTTVTVLLIEVFNTCYDKTADSYSQTIKVYFLGA